MLGIIYIYVIGYILWSNNNNNNIVVKLVYSTCFHSSRGSDWSGWKISTLLSRLIKLFCCFCRYVLEVLSLYKLCIIYKPLLFGQNLGLKLGSTSLFMRPSLFGVNKCMVSGEVSLAPFGSSLKYQYLFFALCEKLHSNNWNKNLIIIIINWDLHLKCLVMSSAVGKLDRYLSILYKICKNLQAKFHPPSSPYMNLKFLFRELSNPLSCIKFFSNQWLSFILIKWYSVMHGFNFFSWQSLSK